MVVAVNAKEAVIDASDEHIAPAALGLDSFHAGHHHADTLLVLQTGFVLVNAVEVDTQSKTGLASAHHHQVFSQVVEHIEPAAFKQFGERVFEALVLGELSSVVVLVADLALHHDLGTLFLDVLEQFLPGHVLEVFVVADVAPELRTVHDGMLLQLLHRLPDQLAILAVFKALVWKLAEVNAVLKNIVNVPEEITNGFAVRTLHFVSLLAFSKSLLLFSQQVFCELFPFISGHLGHFYLHFRVMQFFLAVGVVHSFVQKKQLAEFTEKFAAMLALLGFVREVVAHHAPDFFNHFALQLVLNRVQFDVQLRNGFGPHDLLDGLVRNEEFFAILVHPRR